MYFSFANRCVRGGMIARFSCVRQHRSINILSRNISSANSDKGTELGSSTILIQDGYNVQELPVIVRKIKDVFVLCDNNFVDEKSQTTPCTESNNYPLIKEEFKHCVDLKDVFSLLSKCSKITPNIALVAVERIYELENLDLSSPFGEKPRDSGANMAKGAIVDKLMNIVNKTEDTQTLLNALWAITTEPHRYNFTDELLVRVSDDRLNIEQLCEFIRFLDAHKIDPHFTDTVDKLWTGFAERESEVNEKNLMSIFRIVPALKASKKMMFNLLEKKLSTLWWKIKPPEMQEILDVLSKEKYSSFRALQVVGRWTNTNIHTLSEDTLLDIITKLTSLQYHDSQLEKALERYIKVKGIKIDSHTLMVGILNHCVFFRIRNNHILNGCSEYFAAKGMSIPAIFLKSFIYPFGFLYFHPTNGVAFWRMVEDVLEDKLSKLKVEDVLDVMLSCVYLQKYPLNFVDKIFNPHFLAKLNNSGNPGRSRIKLKLIDTAMSLECKSYSGPLLPKDHWVKTMSPDSRTRRLINNISDILEKVAGGADCFSKTVLIPNLFANELYVVDAMLHPAGLGRSILNLNLKSDRNINVAVLVHLPEHYCAGSDQLIGSQMMRRKHLKLLGLKIVSLKYDTLYKLKIHSVELEKYIVERLKQAESSL